MDAGGRLRRAMITFAEIETELEKAGATRELSRAVSRALELSQRKTASEVETNLKEWMENRFVTKDEFQREMGLLRSEFHRELGRLQAEMAGKIGDLRGDMMKWMFIFWSSQLVAIAGMLFGFFKLLRP